MNVKKKKSTPVMKYCPKCRRLVQATKTYYQKDNGGGMVETVCHCGKLIKRQEF